MQALRKSWRMVSRILASAVIVAAYVVVAPTAPAFGYSAQCGTNSNYHVAAVTGQGGEQQLEGVSAILMPQTGYTLCTSDLNNGTNFSTVWTMSVGQNGGYAQSGEMYRIRYGNCVAFWAEQASDPNNWTDYYLPNNCSVPGNPHQFWQQVYSSGGLHMRSNVDQTVIHQSTFDPLATWGRPLNIQISGEATYRESDVPGRPGSPEDFSNTQWQSTANGGWNGVCGSIYMGSVNENPNNWTGPVFSCNDIKFWSNS